MTTIASMLPRFLLFLLVGGLVGIVIRMALMEGEGCHGGAADAGGEVAPAPEQGNHVDHGTPEPEIVFRVGNAVCPEMGGKVNEKTRPAVVAGIAIGICCAACIEPIESEPARAIRKIFEQEKDAGPRLASYLEKHPDIARQVGLEPEGGEPAPGEAPATRPAAAPGKLSTPLLNTTCPVDGRPVEEGLYGMGSGLVAGLCREGCRAAFEKAPRTHLLKLEQRDPVITARLEAHENLQHRGGHGPHYACASCQIRSAASGPCPDCTKPLVRAADEPPFVLQNRLCPVMGEEIAEATTLVHEGIEVRLCCPKCEATFRQYPPYYLSKIEREEGIRVPRIVEEKR